MRDSAQCRNYEEELLPESTRSLKEVQHIIKYAESKSFLRVWIVSVVVSDPDSGGQKRTTEMRV